MNCENYKNCANFKEKETNIYVPDKVRFTASTSGYSMGLGFSNVQQEMHWDFGKEIFMVTSPYGSIAKPKLISCTKEDIGIGEWGFRNGIKDADFTQKWQYCLNIGKYFIYVKQDGLIEQSYSKFNHWWKVVEQK